MKINNSAIIYQGPSLLDGNPIVAIATGFFAGNNIKLGANVVQVYVLRADMPPLEALVTGGDRSICGNCPLRRQICYVNVAYAPTQMYTCYRKDNYKDITPEQLQVVRDHNKVLRLTAYGDIAAIPLEAVKPLMNVATTTIGYTHQWRSHPEYKGLLMASCETEEGAILAQSLGWKSFRVKALGDPLLSHEKICTNQTNKAVQCQDCRLCDGRSDAIAIDVHGLNWRQAAFHRSSDFSRR